MLAASKIKIHNNVNDRNKHCGRNKIPVKKKVPPVQCSIALYRLVPVGMN